ncbi:MAG: hypothetical protein WC509_02325 [Candidatus Izemoplasmatales bacterium]
MKAYLDIHYGIDALQHLMLADKALSPYIEKYGRVNAKRDPDVFSVLVWAIVSDGLSIGNASAIEQRMTAKYGGLTVSDLIKADVDSMRELGLSLTKAETIAAIVRDVVSGRLDLVDTYHYDDEGYVGFFSSIKGVSHGAAETVAIFSEGRLDVFMFGDAAYQRAVMQVHGYTSYSKERHERLRRLYSPYGTVASLYYLAIADELARGVER